MHSFLRWCAGTYPVVWPWVTLLTQIVLLITLSAHTVTVLPHLGATVHVRSNRCHLYSITVHYCTLDYMQKLFCTISTIPCTYLALLTLDHEALVLVDVTHTADHVALVSVAVLGLGVCGQGQSVKLLHDWYLIKSHSVSQAILFVISPHMFINQVQM